MAEKILITVEKEVGEDGVDYCPTIEVDSTIKGMHYAAIALLISLWRHSGSPGIKPSQVAAEAERGIRNLGGDPDA